MTFNLHLAWPDMISSRPEESTTTPKVSEDWDRTTKTREEMSTRRISVTLSEYVERRNGVPLGARGSLARMLHRSLGAATFAGFWRYWNPIWGYYLSRYVNVPLRKIMPAA